jgi:hypothetical protein
LQGSLWTINGRSGQLPPKFFVDANRPYREVCASDIQYMGPIGFL